MEACVVERGLLLTTSGVCSLPMGRSRRKNEPAAEYSIPAVCWTRLGVHFCAEKRREKEEKKREVKVSRMACCKAYESLHLEGCFAAPPIGQVKASSPARSRHP